MGVQDCQKLVNYLYSRYFKKYSRFRDDLISSGYIGFYKALKKYDADKSVKFSTYVSACIVNEMRSFLRKEMKHYNDRIDDIDTVNEIVSCEMEVYPVDYDIGLTEEEYKICEAISKGKTYTEIAKEINVRRRLIYTKVNRIRRKYIEEQIEERELQIYV